MRVREKIRAVCVKHGVRSLWLFGSATGASFDPSRSDLDFVVDFGEVDLGPWMARFFDFKRELQSLLGRSVDLVLASAVDRSPTGDSIRLSRVPIYAAA